ncbi:MAG: DNA-binding protein [Candidatus Aenigmarchaeota archaeon]|nr:DNA-binding protein [Candidatus Aenigmarchaeota archaeon]
MLLVADANIFVSALISRGFTLDLFFSDKLQPIVPDWIFGEIEEHKYEILEKSGLSEDEFNLFISLLITRVEIEPAEDFKEWLSKAEKISPDPDDVQYFALALKYNCPIWSNDPDFKQQSVVEALTTEDVVKLLGL